MSPAFQTVGGHKERPLSYQVPEKNLVVYSLKMCSADGLATQLHQQIDREKVIRAQLEDKLGLLNTLETQSKDLDNEQRNLQKEIISKKEQLEIDQKLFQNLVNTQGRLSLRIQHERETMVIKDEEYKQEMSKIEQHVEFRKAAFINKMSLYNKEIDAYNEQEATLKKIICKLKEDKTASKTLQELELMHAQKLKHIEESRQLLADLSKLEEKINTDIREKLSTINLGSTTL